MNGGASAIPGTALADVLAEPGRRRAEDRSAVPAHALAQADRRRASSAGCASCGRTTTPTGRPAAARKRAATDAVTSQEEGARSSPRPIGGACARARPPRASARTRISSGRCSTRASSSSTTDELDDHAYTKLLRAGSTVGRRPRRLPRGSRAALAGDGARRRRARAASAKACILLWMNGGPSHIDTLDPKPGTRGRTVQGDQDERARRDDLRAHAAARRAGAQARDRARHDEQRGQPPARAVPAPHGLRAEPHRRASRRSARGSAKRCGDPTHRAARQFVSLGGPSVGAGFLGVAARTVRRADAGAAARRTSATAAERRRRALRAAQAPRSTALESSVRDADRRREDRGTARALRQGRCA